MTGLNDTDIRLDGSWQLTQAADGGAPLCTGADCLLQNLILEALTQPGDLFYDPSFGWGLCDFIQSEDDALTRLELEQRARFKLQARTVILPESITVAVSREDDVFRLCCRFQFSGEAEARQLNLIIGAVSVEVEKLD